MISDHMDDLPARLDRFNSRLEELVKWLDIIDKLSLKLGHPELAGTEMQEDIATTCADARRAAARIRELEAEVAEWEAIAEDPRDNR